MVINIFLTIGRTGQFTFLMTSIFLAIMYFRNNWKYILYSLVGLVIVFILAFNFSSNTNARMKHGYSDIEKVIKEKDFNTSWGIRLSSYIIIPDIIKDERFNIFYGMGYCKVNDNIMDIQLNKFGKDSGFKDTFGYLHNTYISMLAGTGFVGFVIFIIFWFYLFFVRIEDYYLSFIRYANMFVITFQGISNELFWQHEIMLLSAVFISITTYVTTKNNKEELNA
jgi:O-antigen ligase